MDIQQEMMAKAQTAKAASRKLAVLSTGVKNAALLAMADALEKRAELILEANAADLEEARGKGLKRSYLDRLMLNEGRIRQMAEGLRQTAALPDPICQGDYSTVRPNGLEIRRIRVPIGVIGIIYEARPNVTADATA
ncbi:MAG: gamma-glutamyl-phosphate reductase, partial [Selenomonas sp.]|nr:gamma-glutamyl-phosphate reductase [Selenomonas sp.]